MEIGKIVEMRKLNLAFSVFLLSMATIAGAQEVVSNELPPVEMSTVEAELQPEIDVDAFIPAGEKVLFDGSKSGLLSPSAGVPVYSWDMGDGSRVKWGAQIGHEFWEPGRYTVGMKLRQGMERAAVSREVTVFTRKAVLIADPDLATRGLVERAGKYGIWLDVIPFSRSVSEVSADEQFVRKLQARRSFVADADMILFYTDSYASVQGFANWWKQLPEDDKFDPKAKAFGQFTESSLSQLRKLSQAGFDILQPESILLTRPESADILFSTSFQQVTDELKSRGIEFDVLDNRASASWLLPVSRTMTYFVSHGVSQGVLFLLLAVPFITFVIAFARQVIGLRTFGVFAPLMLALSFLLLGLHFGFAVFAVVMVVSYLIRLLFDRVELLYIPKISLLLSALALSFFLVLGLAVHFEIDLNLALAVFPMLVMSTVSEKFLSAQSEGGLKSAVRIAGETVVVALVAFGLVHWEWMSNLIIAFPEMIFLPIIGTIWLGRWTGLRLTEYFRFAALFRDDSREE